MHKMKSMKVNNIGYSSIKLMYIHKKMYGFFNNSSINLKVKTNKQYIRIRVMGKLFLYIQMKTKIILKCDYFTQESNPIKRFDN